METSSYLGVFTFFWSLLNIGILVFLTFLILGILVSIPIFITRLFFFLSKKS